MKRWGLPIAAVLLLVAIAAVSQRLGYLGRRDGGPLEQPGGYASHTNGDKPRRWAVISWPIELEKGAVRITDAHPRAVSPGARVSPLRINRAFGGPGPRWPPRGDLGRAVGRRLTAAQQRGALMVAMRARRPGIYVLDGYDIDYEQGARQYRRRLDYTLCISVRRLCAQDLRLPRKGRLADMGGPSSYAATLKGDGFDDGKAGAGGFPVDGDSVDAVYRAEPQTKAIRLTLTNRTDDRLRVTDIGFRERIEGLTIRVTGPRAPLTFAPGASQSVPLTLRITGCDPDSPGSRTTFSELDARIDGDRERVPLLVGLAFESVGDRC